MLFKKQAVHDAWAATERTLDFKVTVKGKNYTATDISSLSYDSGAMNGEALTLGSTYTNTIKITFSHLIEGLALLDEITPQIGIQLPDGTWDFTSLGVFIIDAEVQQDRNNNTTTLSASDRMCMMGGTYESKLSYPAAINDIAAEIAAMAGVGVNVDDFARLPTEKILSLGNVTYRDAIGYVAQFAGGFATFDRSGLLDVRVLNDPNFVVTPDQYQSKGLTKNETFYRIGGIACNVVRTSKDDSGNETEETTTLQSGSTSGTQITLVNPGMTQILLDGLYQQLQDINFYPFSLSWFGDPALEAGDWITVKDTAGNDFKTPNLLYSLTFGGGVTATSKADTTITAAANFVYKGATTQFIANVRRYLNAAGHAVSEGIDEPTSPKAGDIWFKKEGPDTTIETYVIDPETGIGSWSDGPSTKPNTVLLNTIDQAQKDATAAGVQAGTAVNTANQAVAAAGFNTDQIATIKSDMATAVSQANTAYDSATTALGNAATALSTAKTASDDASTAIANAATAINAATDAQAKTNTLVTKVDDIAGTIETLATTETVNKLAGTVTTVQNLAQFASDGLKLKADVTTVDTLTQTVTKQGSQLALTATKAELQVAQTNVDNLKKTVTSNTAGMTANADALKLKADSSTVSTLDGRVTSLSGQLDVQSGLISAKVTASDVTGMLNGYATQSWSEGKISAAKNEISASVQSLTSDMATQTWTASQLKIKSDSLTSQISNVQSAVDNMQVGARNYILNSDQAFIINGDTDHFRVIEYHLTPGTWTFSANASYTRGADTKIFIAVDDVNKTMTSSVQQNIINGRVTWTFVAGETDVLLLIYATGGTKYVDTVGKTLELTHYKLEQGNMATDWTPAPEDQATVQQFTEIQQNLNGLQTTVNNNATATQSQFTQLSNQFTSTINGIGTQNLLIASGNGISANNIYNMGQYKMSERMVEGQQYTVTINGAMNHGGHWGIYLNGGMISLSTGPEIITNTSGSFTLTFNGVADSTKDSDTIWIYNMPNPVDNIRWAAIYWVTMVKGSKGTTDYVQNRSEIATQSQFTQLQSDINLRVKTGDLISQINVSAGNVLIQSGKLYLDAASVVMGGTAFINAANIKSVNASTITTGTLDAATVNVVGINASNITTGTINGANLSINLTTGEILFQKGAIRSTNGNLNIDINSGNMAVTNPTGNGFRFEDGKLFLTNKDWIDSFQSKPEYGYIAFNPNFLSNIKGMQIAGTDGIAVTAGDCDISSFIFQNQPKSGAALSIHDNTAFLNAREHTRIEGGGMYTEAWPWTNKSRAAIVVGGANGGVNQDRATDQDGNYHLQEPVNVGTDLFMKGYKITLQGGNDNATTSSPRGYQLADLNLGNDGSGYVSSTAIYNRTYSSGDHVVITSWGTLGRLTSARKYKIADQVATGIVAKAQRALSISPAEWYDKAEIESIADAKTNSTEAPGEAKIEKHYGFIADDFDAAGLTEVVNYHNGEVDSLSYDHISMYHHVILTDHEKRIAELEAEVKQLKGEI